MEPNGSYRSNIFFYAKTRNVNQLKAFLDDGGEVNRIDGDTGSNALHLLYAEVCLSEECQERVAKCTELLLQAGINVNVQNHTGHVPLYLALKNEWNKSALQLTLNGADLTVRVEGQLLATYLTDTQPEIFYELLDQDVRLDEHKNELLHLDFRNIFQYHDLRGKNLQALLEANAKVRHCDETAFLYSISHTVRCSPVFEHPLLLFFIQLKYHKLKYIILLSFLWQAAIVTLYTLYVYFVYVDLCPFEAYNKVKELESRMTTTTPNPTLLDEVDDILTCNIPVGLKVVSGILTALEATMLASEFQVWWYKARRSYFTTRTIPWFVFYVLMPISLWPSMGSSDEYIVKWRYPIAAFSVFLIWALCLEQFGKIQRLAILYDMFIKIAVTIVKLTLLFTPLFVGFTVGFFIMDAEDIENWYSIITVISLMMGDLKYDDLFNEDKQRESSEVYALFANVLYLLFLLFMSVVFINYILAVTVNDIGKLWTDTERSQTKKKIQLMYIFDRLKVAKLKVIPTNLILQGRFEYILNVTEPPSHVDPAVVEKLRQLAVKRGCEHRLENKLQNGSSSGGVVALPTSKAAAPASSSSSLSLRRLQADLIPRSTVTLNSKEAGIIYEALHILQTKLNINNDVVGEEIEML